MYYINNVNSIIFYIFFFFLVISLIFVFCLIINSYKRSRYYEKLSAYECGFDPFDYAREPFSIKFFVIAILFLIFDIEIIFFFPWVLNFSYLNFQSFISMYIFIIFLLLGFFYEYLSKCLKF